jgi:hypothetical protein
LIFPKLQTKTGFIKAMDEIFSTHKQNVNEMARAIVLTSKQWFLLSGTENTDGGLIINLNEMQKRPGLYQSKETSTIYFFKQFSYVLPIVCRSG